MKAIIDDNKLNKIVVLNDDKYMVYDQSNYYISEENENRNTDRYIIEHVTIRDDYIEGTSPQWDKYEYNSINWFSCKDYQLITILSSDIVFHNFYSHIPELLSLLSQIVSSPSS